MPTAAELLRDAGLRLTAPRVAVLEQLLAGGHHSADDLAAALRLRLGTVSTQAVYDVLRALASAGLARPVEPAGRAAHYEARVGDNHHHAVCRRCGAITDVDCAVGVAACLEPNLSDLPPGFAVDEAEVTYWGRCPDCQHPDREETR